MKEEGVQYLKLSNYEIQLDQNHYNLPSDPVVEPVSERAQDYVADVPEEYIRWFQQNGQDVPDFLKK